MFAGQHSRNYQDLIRMISGNILAANPRNANAHVVGYLAGDLLCRTIVPGQKGLLYMLDGPTSEVWIDPWVSHLKTLGVNLHLNSKVTEIQMDASGKKIASATIEDTTTGKSQTVSGDVFFASVPAEKMTELLSPELVSAAPSMKDVPELQTAWMVGLQVSGRRVTDRRRLYVVNIYLSLQLYLRRNVDIVHGTIGFLHSPWALAGLSQDQFRPWLDLSQYGNGEVSL